MTLVLMIKNDGTVRPMVNDDVRRRHIKSLEPIDDETAFGTYDYIFRTWSIDKVCVRAFRQDRGWCNPQWE
jgi:hypothetical protein